MIKLKPAAFTLLAVFASSNFAFAQADLPIEASDGYRFTANTILLTPSPSPRPIFSGVATERENVLQLEAEKIFASGTTKAALVSRQSRIFVEKYARGVSPSSTPLGFSISKSLVALTIGKAMCEGLIKNLDDKSDVYAPALKGTSYGNASIKQLLLMTSGAAKTDFNTGHPNPKESFILSNMWQARGLDVDLIQRMQSNSGYINPGVEFNYNNYDTQALVFVVEGATGLDFTSYFDREIWKKILPERSGAWLRNKDNSVAGWVGFSAAPNDYLRIGHFLIEEMKNKDDCFSKFMTEATKNLITPMTGRGYGYQIHKLSLRLAPDSFWFLGFGGQVLGVDPKSETVVYLHSINFNHTPQWIGLISGFMGEFK